MARDNVYGSSSLHVGLGEGNSNILPLAQDVALQRGTLVAETLFHLAAIRSLQGSSRAGDEAGIQCVAAQVQDSGAQFDQQSAHLLPGQILIGGRPVWELVGGSQAAKLPAHELVRLEQQTKMCFAKTNVLPAVFNRADSQAERMAMSTGVQGLKELFAAAVREMWTKARVDPERPLVIDRDATLLGLKTWFDQVNLVYESASRRKDEAAASAQATQSGRAQDRAAEARILAVFAESFKVANVALFAAARLPQIHERYRSL